MSRTYRSIHKTTFGIIFFGTPHRGGNHAFIGSAMATVARVVSGGTKNTLMSSIRSASILSEIMADEFRQCVADLSIVSFYEERATSGLGIVSGISYHED